ncbi:MAG: Abi family protein [Bacilli bacterium]|nr:Abi family protein [Bacilli bacterium]
MRDKQFKNLDEQIEIFKFKGLVINDEKYAKDILLRENYFFLSGYRHLFMQSDNQKFYIKGTTFEELYSLFIFDRQFRNIIFKNLLIVENNAKSIFSYQLSKKYGYKENDYLKPANFDMSPEKSRQVNDLIKKMKRQVRVNGSQHSATMHYLSNYGYIPLWVLVKVLSFGIISEFYSILKAEDKASISKIYNISVDDLTNYLSILANYRNVCAHEDILYENKTQRSINDTVYHILLGIEKKDGEYVKGKNDLFALIIILRQILRDEDVKNLILELERLINNLSINLHTIGIEKVLDRMGFPLNWKEIANIEKRSYSNEE